MAKSTIRKDELMKLKVSELKENAQKMNLEVKGLKKEELVDLIIKEERRLEAKAKREAKKESKDTDKKVVAKKAPAKEDLSSKELPAESKKQEEVKEVKVQSQKNIPEKVGLEKFEKEEKVSNINKLAGWILLAVLAFVLLLCTTNGAMSKRKRVIDLADDGMFVLTAPDNWYPDDNKMYYALENDKVDFRMTYQVNYNIKKEAVDSFYQEIRNFFIHQDCDDENEIILFNEEEMKTYSIFKFFPEKEIVVEFAFINYPVEEGLKLVHNMRVN